MRGLLGGKLTMMGPSRPRKKPTILRGMLEKRPQRKATSSGWGDTNWEGSGTSTAQGRSKRNG